MDTKALLMQNLGLVALSFGDMTSQNFPQKKGTCHQIRLFTLGFNFQEISFYVQNRSSRPKIDTHVNFSNFPVEEKFFHFVHFWDISMRKDQQQPPPPPP